jgi:hypothetical protein
MTPKEKADELFLKFRQIPPSSPYTGVDDGEAKQCALIAVDEILDELLEIVTVTSSKYIIKHINYYQEIKQEIEKL